jgi:hypothetical protein
LAFVRTLHTTIQFSSVFVFLALFTVAYALLAASSFGSALAISSSGGNAGAGDNAVSSTSKTSSPSSNSHSTKGSAVIELPVNTGDPTLDKQIDKFYSCVSKTHLDPPSKDQVAGCYFQFVGGDSGNSQSSSRDTTSTHSHSHSISKIDNSPPGMLVEVP